MSRCSQSSWYVLEEPDHAVCAACEHPRLLRMEGKAHDAEPTGDRMAAQDLQWNYQRVLEQVAGK